MTTRGYEANKNNLIIYDYGVLTKETYTESFDYSIESAKWCPDGKSIYFNAAVEGAVQMFSLTLSESGSKISQITDQYQDITEISVGLVDKKAVIIGNVMSMSMPSELFQIIPKGKKVKITSVNTDMLSHIKMGKVKNREIKAKDGKDILTWVIYLPDFNPKGKKISCLALLSRWSSKCR